MSQTSELETGSLFQRLQTATFEIPERRIWLTWLALTVGLFLRVIEYSDNRQLYLDERLLLENLTDLPVWDFHTVLENDQLAPPGFLVVERLMVRLPLPIIPSARFIPFLAAIFAMASFPWVARRYVVPWAVPLATAWFALSDYTIYYASEIKQYSIEVALALAALWLAARIEDEETSTERKKRLATLAVFGVVGVWFSLPLIFNLAAIGLAGLGIQVVRRDWRQAGVWMAIGVAWVLSFGGCFLVCDRIVTKAPFLRTWWDFAFLRIPPKSIAEATEVFWQLVNVVIGPTGVISPTPHVYTALLGSALCLFGTVVMARRTPAKTLMVVAPFVLAIAAAALKHYPFHGRLIQFLIPTVLFVLAEGVVAFGRWGRIGRLIGIALAVFLLIQPAYQEAYFRFIQGRARPYDSHGDLHNDLLDELEANARQRMKIPPISKSR